MPRTLTAADRSALIRLAATMGKGSPERKAILAGLEKAAEDHVAFNDSLKKLLKGLKRDTGAKKIKQTYKGKGGEAARSQQLVEWSGATLGIWPDKGFVSLRGPRTSREVYDADGKWLKTDRTPPTTDRIDYGSKTPEAVYKEIVKALSEWLPKGKTAGLEKSASLLMGIQQIIGKLVNDRTLKAHRPTQVITKNPPQGQITLHGIRDNLTITVGQNKDGLGYFAVGKKDGKTHVFVSSRRPIPLGGRIQKITDPIIEAVKEWEAGQEPLFKAGSARLSGGPDPKTSVIFTLTSRGKPVGSVRGYASEAQAINDFITRWFDAQGSIKDYNRLKGEYEEVLEKMRDQYRLLSRLLDEGVGRMGLGEDVMLDENLDLHNADLNMREVQTKQGWTLDDDEWIKAP